MLRRIPFIAFAIFTAGAAEARPAGDDARLRSCGAATCVVLTGERADPTAAVVVAGHAVNARGGRRFEVAVPVETVRAWSAPFARTIAMWTTEAGAASREVRLPIGLLGQASGLDALEVSAR